MSEFKLLCFYCCHTSEKLNHMPLSYCEKTNEFTFFGNFCSYECMKSYNLFSNSSYKHPIFNYIQMLHDKVEDNKDIIKFAPPLSLLEAFGGTLDIDTFRQCNTSFRVYEHPIKIEEKYIERYENFSASNDVNRVHEKENEVLNEPIKLKRKTPKPTSQNTLEKTMGLFRI